MIKQFTYDALYPYNWSGKSGLQSGKFAICLLLLILQAFFLEKRYMILKNMVDLWNYEFIIINIVHHNCREMIRKAATEAFFIE